MTIVIISSTPDNVIPGCLCAISCTKDSIHVKCYMYKERFSGTKFN